MFVKLFNIYKGLNEIYLKLIKNIEEFDQYQYEQRVDEFMKEKGCIDDGQASKRTVDFILQLMEDAKMNKGKKRRKK